MTGVCLDAEVAVVGAGPAGCHAARRLAERGFRVLLLDRARFPRVKPCGGALSQRALALLPEALRALADTVVDAAELRLGSAAVVRLAADAPVGRLVHRPSFDLAHLELAARLPEVEVREGAAVTAAREVGDRVELETAGGTLTARAVVAADGAESAVARSLGLAGPRRMAVAVEAEAVLGSAGRSLLFDFAAFPGGYGWVFAKGAHSSVGGCVVEGPAQGLRGRLEAFWSGLGLSGRPEGVRGARVPMGGVRLPAAGRRTVLAGDAAGTVDPLTGEGIGGALESAEMAAAAVDRFLRDGEPLSAYDRALWRRIHRPMRLARIAAPRLYRRPEATFRLLLSDRVVGAEFVELLRGGRSYGRLVATALLRVVVGRFSAHRGDDLEYSVP